MAHTSTPPATESAVSTWDTLVDNARERITTSLESGTCGIGIGFGFEDSVLVRPGTPKLVRMFLSEWRWPIVSVAATVLALYGFEVAEYDSDRLVLLLGLAAAVVVSSLVLTHLCASRYTVEPSSSASYLVELVENATREVRQCDERGQVGAGEALPALESIHDGVVELAIELSTLHALASRNHGLIRGDYGSAVSGHAKTVTDELVEIAAEATAAARVQFANRDDLVVQVSKAAAVEEIDLGSLSVRTARAQERLSAGRAELARLAGSALGR